MKKHSINKRIVWKTPQLKQLDIKKTAGGVGNANENAHTPGS